MTCFWRDLTNLDQLCDADGPPTEPTYSLWDMSAYGGVSKIAITPTRIMVANPNYNSGNGSAWILDLNGSLQNTCYSAYGSVSNYGSFVKYIPDRSLFYVGVISGDFGGNGDCGLIDSWNIYGSYNNKITTSPRGSSDYFGTDICYDLSSNYLFAPAYGGRKLARINTTHTVNTQVTIPNDYGSERHQTAVIASGYLVTSGYTANYGGYSQNGVLRVWNTTPTYQRLCIHPYPNNNAYMGRPLTSTGTYAVAGAFGTTVSGTANAGMVLFFDPSNGNCVNYIDMTAAGLTLATNSYFGYSLYYHTATSSLFVITTDTVCEFAVSGYSVTHTKNYIAANHTFIIGGGLYGLPSSIVADSTKVYAADQNGDIVVWTR